MNLLVKAEDYWAKFKERSKENLDLTKLPKVTTENSFYRIPTLIAVIIAIHYFLSYYLIIQYLKDYNLDITSVLSCEDVLFTTAPLSITSAFDFAITPFISIIFISLVLNWKQFWNVVKGKSMRKQIIIAIILIFAIISFILFLVIKTRQIAKIISLHFILAYILYNLKPKKLNITLLLLTIIAIMSIYNDIKKSGYNLYSNDIKLHLENDSIVESNQKDRLVFWGTKYVIIGKSSTKSAVLYPTSQIKQIDWVAR